MSDRIWVITLALFICAHTWSHEVDRTFFEVHFEKDSVRIDAEFPFTLRQAMFNDLDNDSLAYINYYGKNAFEYHEIMEFYFRKNLFLINNSGDTTFLHTYRKGEPKEHSHGGEIEFVFVRSSHNLTLHNSLMIGFKEDFINQHIVWKGGEKFKFETKKGSTSFKLPSSSKEKDEEKSKKTNLLPWFTFGACVLLFGAGLFFRMKRRKSK